MRALLDSISDELAGATPLKIEGTDIHSNDVAEISFSDGRILVFKHARYDWARSRFKVARRASEILRDNGIICPAPLATPPDLSDMPTEAYWRIPSPIMAEVWPDLSDEQKASALQAWGSLARRIHKIKLNGQGKLLNVLSEESTLENFLRSELIERLGSEITKVWTDAIPALEAAINYIPEVQASRPTGRFLHNDLHMKNVLVDVNKKTGEVSCPGVLDLEAAFVGPKESDLAHTQVLHGPLFGQHLEFPGWKEAFMTGYGKDVKENILAFFRIYHLINLGYYFAITNRHEHAKKVAALANQSAEMLL